MKEVYTAIKAIIKYNEKFLIIKQSFLGKEAWDLPGGRVEFGESPYDTLKREIREEVNLVVRIIKPLGLFWFFRYDGAQVICTTFICHIDNTNNIDLSKSPDGENIIEYRWVTKEEFLSEKYNVIHDSLKNLLKLL